MVIRLEMHSMASLLDIPAAQGALSHTLGIVQLVLGQMKDAVDKADPDAVEACWRGLDEEGELIMRQIDRMRAGIAARDLEAANRALRMAERESVPGVSETAEQPYVTNYIPMGN